MASRLRLRRLTRQRVHPRRRPLPRPHHEPLDLRVATQRRQHRPDEPQPLLLAHSGVGRAARQVAVVAVELARVVLVLDVHAPRALRHRLPPLVRPRMRALAVERRAGRELLDVKQHHAAQRRLHHAPARPLPKSSARRQVRAQANAHAAPLHRRRHRLRQRVGKEAGGLALGARHVGSDDVADGVAKDRQTEIRRS